MYIRVVFVLLLIMAAEMTSARHVVKRSDDAHPLEAVVSTHSQDKAEATLHVDGTEVRLMLLESHQAALQKQNDLLKTENSHLKDNLTQQQQALTQLNSTQVKAGQHVSFHALGLQNYGHLSQGDTMLVPNVLTNEGNAYNSSTGYFTAPYSGTYLFAANSGSASTNNYAAFELLVDGTRVVYGQTTDPGPGESTSIQAVVHVAQGLSVWLRALTSVTYFSTATSFSGFLLYSD
ncbi:caprin-2-like isoform X1 [Littorina saxatilis]|uniref:caprin-2-like isoform X1 n=1 Tax=Littorina saxatilis TaxID=31220 RepID=UPI0038B5E915